MKILETEVTLLEQRLASAPGSRVYPHPCRRLHEQSADCFGRRGSGRSRQASDRPGRAASDALMRTGGARAGSGRCGGRKERLAGGRTAAESGTAGKVRVIDCAPSSMSGSRSRASIARPTTCCEAVAAAGRFRQAGGSTSRRQRTRRGPQGKEKLIERARNSPSPRTGKRPRGHARPHDRVEAAGRAGRDVADALWTAFEPRRTPSSPAARPPSPNGTRAVDNQGAKEAIIASRGLDLRRSERRPGDATGCRAATTGSAHTADAMRRTADRCARRAAGA